MFNALRKADKERVQKAAVKITEKARLTRRKIRAMKKGAQKEKVSYMPGGFGISKDPEILVCKKQKRKRNLTLKSDSNNEIASPKQIIEITFVRDVTIAFIVDNGQL